MRFSLQYNDVVRDVYADELVLVEYIEYGDLLRKELVTIERARQMFAGVRAADDAYSIENDVLCDILYGDEQPIAREKGYQRR